ncbi:MAG: dienelactone hydrolase family protein [Desulfofustis sp.]|nr:dienelactone hydrolase family protein [Desulfofustis sp.]
MKIVLLGAILLFLTPLGVAAKAVSYEVEGKSYEGYYQEAGQGKPLLILVHDWDGLTDYEIKRAEMLAELGYNVFAVDLFGKGVRPTETDHKKLLTGELYKDRERMRNLFKAAYAEAQKMAGESPGTVTFGYCFGGAVVLEMARSGMDLDGFASFHGGLTTPEGQDYSAAKGKIMVFHGTADSAISMEDFGDLAVELEEAQVAHEMVTYSGAPHAFTVFGSDRYREEADKQSWSRFTGFLEEKYK